MELEEDAVKKYSPETLMMGYGYNPWWSEGAVKTPLFLTSTFLFKSAEDGEEFFKVAYGLKAADEKKPSGLIYSRLNNPELEILEERIRIWERTEAAAAFSSGMAAISTMVFTLCSPGDEVIYSLPIYGGTDYFFEHIIPKFNIRCISVPGGDNFCDGVRAMKDKLKKLRLIFVETPANPTIIMTDIAQVAALRDEFRREGHDTVFAVDNTFMGPVFQQCVPLGADLAVYSATKFLGGHSDLIAGALAGKKEWINPIKNYRTILGSAGTPFVCWLLLRSLETLKIRMEKQAENARQVAEWLRTQPRIKKVLYPDLFTEGSSQQEIYRKQCSGPGSLISFEVGGGKPAAFKILNSLHVCKLAVSLGGTETLIEHPQTMTHADVSPEVQKLAGIAEGLIRLSVGIENPQDIISDLKQAMSLVSP